MEVIMYASTKFRDFRPFNFLIIKVRIYKGFGHSEKKEAGLETSVDVKKLLADVH
jgi:hypothetical protein